MERRRARQGLILVVLLGVIVWSTAGHPVAASNAPLTITGAFAFVGPGLPHATTSVAVTDLTTFEAFYRLSGGQASGVTGILTVTYQGKVLAQHPMSPVPAAQTQHVLYTTFYPPEPPDTGQSTVSVDARYTLLLNGAPAEQTVALTVTGICPRSPCVPTPTATKPSTGGGGCSPCLPSPTLHVRDATISHQEHGRWVARRRLYANEQARFAIDYVATIPARTRSPAVALQVRIKNNGGPVLTLSARQQPPNGRVSTLAVVATMRGKTLLGPLVAAVTVWYGSPDFNFRRELAFSVGRSPVRGSIQQPFTLYHYQNGQLAQTQTLNPGEPGLFVAYVDPSTNSPRTALGFLQIIEGGNTLQVRDTSAACDAFAPGDDYNLCLDAQAFNGRYALERTIRFPRMTAQQIDAYFTIKDRRGPHTGQFCFAIGQQPTCPPGSTP
jgi:hypothetical protein